MSGRSWRPLHAWPLVLAGAIGCTTEPATQLVVVVTSELRVPDQLAEIKATVSDDPMSMTALDEHSFRLAPPPASGGLFELPLSFGVAPDSDPGDNDVVVTVQGFGPMMGMPIITQRRVVTSFVAEKKKLLHIDLEPACAFLPERCMPPTTCVAGACVGSMANPGDVVDSEGLPDVEPGAEFSNIRTMMGPRPDGGMPPPPPPDGG